MESLEQLESMAAQLASAKHIAVDLEAHAFRSFQGFTCLMQISDRHSDYIVDIFKLWEHVGPVLAPIFADPQVTACGQNWTATTSDSLLPCMPVSAASMESACCFCFGPI